MAGLGFPLGGAAATFKDDREGRALLHTCIHNYFVSEGQHDIAKAVLDSGIRIDPQKLNKDKQAHRVNGADDAADSKEDAKGAMENPGDNFLLDYWLIFWDMWNAARDSKQPTVAGQYAAYSQQARQPNMFQQQMMANGNFPRMAQAQNMGNLQHKALNNSAAQRNLNQQQQQFQQRVAMNPQHQQMQRAGSDMDPSLRPPSPNSNGDGAGSPAKRPRTDGAFNQQLVAQQRANMAGQMANGGMSSAEAMLMQQTQQQQVQQAQQQAAQQQHQNKQHQMQAMMGQAKDSQTMYSRTLANQQNQQSVAMGAFPPNAGFNNGVQMSPPMMDQQFDMNVMNGARMAGGVANGTNGGALADYQMQLMLLEQQNKKRLMMAQHERENQQNPNMPPGYPMGTSSPHTRNGQSPPNDNKRKSPMGQGSPLPDGMPNRNSPSVGGFDPAQGMNPHFMPQMSKMIGDPNGGAAMRPPSSHPSNGMSHMEMMRNGGRFQQQPNMNWQGAMPGGPGGPAAGAAAAAQGPAGPQGMTETQMQRGAMPPPQVPANGGKPQPSPTPQNAAPPTPSTTKAGNKKKDSKDTKKKPKKAQAAASAAPNADADRPPTPTPATPATPVAPESHIIKGQPGQNQAQAHAQAQQQQQQQQQHQQQAHAQAQALQAQAQAHAHAQAQQAANGQMQQGQQQPGGDVHMGQGMGAGNGMEPFGPTNDFSNFDFPDTMGGEESVDILGGFDFDTFLGDPSDMDWNTDFQIGDGLESGAGQ